ncbi:MAG: acyl-CoA dehydrogenase family protein, partial [Deltaproteobacteria bacterium]|nr:acyl-CoA dehydrogenase family protein [Deltaproteobacteria bacterium]
MNLTFTEEEEAFRQEVRAWMQEAMPEELRRAAQRAGGHNFEETVEWHKILYAKGWIAPNWPEELGGTGWDATKRFIFNEELEMIGSLRISVLGLSMVGPLIMQFGTDAQKDRFLRKILAGEEFWCQGYSEPNSGSDLASLRMSAEDA